LEDTKKRTIEKNKFEIKKKTGTLDVQEKRTVFVRNLSFDATEDSVKEAFLKYGPIKYVKLCYDKDLERPKGTAFIQFEDNQSALNACAESDIFELDMRKLQIDMAISRTQVNDIVEEKKTSTKETKDGRNLGLLKEGVIYPNSYEAKGISKADMLRRQKLESDNAEKLKLLHYFVSPTRLSVHNIPIKCTDEEFRDIFYKAINNANSETRTHRGGIKECRVMRDLSRVNADGVGRSKGYGIDLYML
jgi:nucleolar protein 4